MTPEELEAIEKRCEAAKMLPFQREWPKDIRGPINHPLYPPSK